MILFLYVDHIAIIGLIRQRRPGGRVYFIAAALLVRILISKTRLIGHDTAVSSIYIYIYAFTLLFIITCVRHILYTLAGKRDRRVAALRFLVFFNLI